MFFQKIGTDYLVRLEVGDELVTSLAALCRQENVLLASVSGLGATNDCDISVYDVQEQRYYKNSFQGTYEITGLAGNVTRMDDEPYLHLHATLGDREGRAFAGHLNRAIISATAEIFLHTYPVEVTRTKDENLGLNLLDLDE